MAAVHILALGQRGGDIPGPAHAYRSVRNGPSGLGALHLDGQRPAAAVRVLIAHRSVAVLIGSPRGTGDRELARLVRLAAAVVGVLVRDRDRQPLYGGLRLRQQDGDGGLVGVVQQAAVRQADGQVLLAAQLHRRAGDRGLAVGVGDDHQIAAHHSFAVLIRSAGSIQLFQFLRLQHLAADRTLLMTAARAVLVRLLVHDPLTWRMARGVGVGPVVGIAAAGTGEGGKAHGRAGGRGHVLLIVMAQGIFNHSATLGTELGGGAGGGVAGNMARSRVSFQAGRAAAGASIFHDALAGTGGVGNKRTLVPAMAQRLRVVRHKGGTAASAGVDGLAPGLAACRNGFGGIVVGQRRSKVGDVPVSADRALVQGVAGAGAGGREHLRLILMLRLRDGALLDVTAPLTDVHGLARRLAGGLPDHYALVGVAQGILVVGLDHLAALGTHQAVIAQGHTAGGHSIMADKVMLTVLIAATPITIRVLAVAVRVPAATAAGAVRRGGQVDIGHAVLHHIGVRIGVGDLVVDSVVARLGVVGGGGQGAGVGAVPVADGGGHARLGEIGDGNSVGRAVRHAVVVRHNRFGGGVGCFGIAAVGAGIHFHKPLVGQLRPDAGLHVVTLQRGVLCVVGAVTEAAILAARGDNTVVLPVYLLNLDALRQVLKEVGGTVIQPVDVFSVAVVGFRHVAVDGPAGLTDRLGPVVAGIISVLAGGAVIDVTLAVSVDGRAVRVFHVPVHGRLTVPGVLRGPVGQERGLLLALAALESLMGDNGVGVQLIGAVVGLLPVFRRVVIAVLLGGGGRRHQGDQHHDGKEACQQRAGTMVFRAHVHYPPSCVDWYGTERAGALRRDPQPPQQAAVGQWLRPCPLTVRIPSSVVAVIRRRSAVAMSFFTVSSALPPQTTSTRARRR